jgi:hypothetical protein
MSVAIDSQTAVIGAPSDEDPNGEEAGSTYIFSASDGEWSQQAKLIPDDGETGSKFGSWAAIDGETVVLGAVGDRDPNGGGAGSAYVFSDDVEWSQQAKLTPDDGNVGDRFGVTVAVNGQTAVIGAPEDEEPNDGGTGAAYVFSNSNREWSQQAKLTADDGDSGDRFGFSVAIDGETKVIGAPGDYYPNRNGDGSAYIF